MHCCSSRVVAVEFFEQTNTRRWKLGARWLYDQRTSVMFAWPGNCYGHRVCHLVRFGRVNWYPLMQQQGREERRSGVILGASGCQLFAAHINPYQMGTESNGVILDNAPCRSIGEFRRGVRDIGKYSVAKPTPCRLHTYSIAIRDLPKPLRLCQPPRLLAMNCLTQHCY